MDPPWTTPPMRIRVQKAAFKSLLHNSMDSIIHRCITLKAIPYLDASSTKHMHATFCCSPFWNRIPAGPPSSGLFYPVDLPSFSITFSMHQVGDLWFLKVHDLWCIKVDDPWFLKVGALWFHKVDDLWFHKVDDLWLHKADDLWFLKVGAL